jgi:hypothetical protein
MDSTLRQLLEQIKIELKTGGKEAIKNLAIYFLQKLLAEKIDLLNCLLQDIEGEVDTCPEPKPEKPLPIQKDMAKLAEKVKAYEALQRGEIVVTLTKDEAMEIRTMLLSHWSHLSVRNKICNALEDK